MVHELASAGGQQRMECTFSLYTYLFLSPSFALIGLLPCSSTRSCDAHLPRPK